MGGLGVRRTDPTRQGALVAGAILAEAPAQLRLFAQYHELVAVQHNAHVRAFFDKLIARGKTPLQAYAAVMRKLLHAIYGMLTTRTAFVSAKFHAAV